MTPVDPIVPTAPRAKRAIWLRRAVSVLGAALLLQFASTSAMAKPKAKAEAAATQSFQLFIESLWPQAQALGISRQTFDLAFKGVTYDPKVIAHTKAQAEFVKPIWEYLASAVSA